MSRPSALELVIVQPGVPRYRAPFFDRASGVLVESGIRTTIIFGTSPGEIRAREDTSDLGSEVPAVSGPAFAHGVSYRRLARAGIRPDLVIVEQAVKNLETYPLLARRRFGGPSIAMWGHGYSHSTRQGPALAALKQFLTRRCDWFFAYTKAGADHVISHGFPAARVSVLTNTIDTQALRRDLDALSQDDVEAFRRRLGLIAGRTALFLGGVDRAKAIGFLIESATAAARQLPGFVLLVGGAGEQLPDVQAAERAGAPVRALGRLDGAAKALALRAADVMVIPRWIGLVAVDSLVAGTPIVTRDHCAHSPESAYLTDGEDSLWMPASCAEAEYAKGVTDLLGDAHRLRAMRAACLKRAPRYGLDSMVEAFAEGVLAWRDITQAGL